MSAAEEYHVPGYDPVAASMEFYDSTATGVRVAGMIDPAMLAEAIQDSRTIMAELDDGSEVAVAVPMDYGAGAGYDVKRSTEEILPYGSRSHTLLYMPNGGLLRRVTAESYDRLVARFAEAGDGYIFSSYGEHDDPLTSAPFELDRILHDAGKLTANVPLLDSKAAAGNQEASLSLYAFDLPKQEESLDKLPATFDDIYDAYQAGVISGKYDHDTENGVVLMRGSEISDQQAADMWQTYQDRFEWLGENHPISMEDNEEDFLRVLRSPSTLCSIRFINGKPECFTDLVGDPDELYWLKSDFLKNPNRMQMIPNQTFLFLPGIVASQAGRNNSAEVIQLLTNATLDTDGVFKVLFENTNRSERYVPRIVGGAINALGRVAIDRPHVVDKTVYTCTQFLQARPRPDLSLVV